MGTQEKEEALEAGITPNTTVWMRKWSILDLGNLTSREF